jgi:predicted DNA-binding protein (MmcQ/YjbR family)
VTEHFPFDNDTLVFKVGDKMFALSSLLKWEQSTPTVNLKCEPDLALELRASYDAVQPGFHMNKKHWNTVTFNQDVDDEKLKDLIDHSYNLVFKSLSLKLQKQLLDEG